MTVLREPDAPPSSGGSAIADSVVRHARWLTLVVLLTAVGCAAATWWQVRRALDGNLLSHFYAFLWPIYGCYVLFLWNRLRHGATSLLHDRAGPTSDPQPQEDDEELRAYNRYLAGKRADAQRCAR